MKIDALYEFVVFAKHLNFSVAAKELYLSQPGLSIHISNLEKELGFLLVDRDNGPTLTPAGLIFLDCAQDILDTYQTGLEDCKSVVGAPPLVRMLSAIDNPELIQAIMKIKDIPVTFVNIDEDTPILRALIKNMLDIGYCVDFSCSPELRQDAEDNNIAWFPFAEFPASISMMKTHPLARKEELRREDFANASIVINSGTYYDSWKCVVQKIFGEDVPLRFRLDPIGSMSNLSFADFGDSIHICGEKANETYLSHRDDVVIFDTLDGEPILNTSVIAYRTDNQNRNVGAFVEALREQLEIGL